MQQNKRTQALKDNKQKQENQKSDTAVLLNSYRAINNEPAFKDILKNVQDFAAYHVKLAQDGVGFKMGKDSDGKVAQEEVYFTQEQRTGHLDKAAGQQEILDFILRKLQSLEVKPSTEQQPLTDE